MTSSLEWILASELQLRMRFSTWADLPCTLASAWSPAWKVAMEELDHFYLDVRTQGSPGPDHFCKKVIGSLISRQLMISRSNRIPPTILLRSDHDPGDPAHYVDRCWIRNFITTIGLFISNITIVKVHKLRGSIYWKMVCLVSTVCIFSMTLIIYI